MNGVFEEEFGMSLERGGWEILDFPVEFLQKNFHNNTENSSVLNLDGPSIQFNFEMKKFLQAFFWSSF